jgi:hypothetical protein
MTSITVLWLCNQLGKEHAAMAGKFGKLLTFTAVVGAATAGIFYFVKHRNSHSFEDFDEDFDTDCSEDSEPSREYVSLDLSGKENTASNLDNGEPAQDETKELVHETENFQFEDSGEDK